jgi:hypothetical protein
MSGDPSVWTLMAGSSPATTILSNRSNQNGNLEHPKGLSFDGVDMSDEPENLMLV